jgi:hypothetical protein
MKSKTLFVTTALFGLTMLAAVATVPTASAHVCFYGPEGDCGNCHAGLQPHYHAPKNDSYNYDCLTTYLPIGDAAAAEPLLLMDYFRQQQAAGLRL